MTVLVLAPELDVTADRMIQVLDGRGVPVVRVDTAWFPQRASLVAELRDGRWVGTLSAGGRVVALEALRSVWYRGPGAFVLPSGLSPTERHWAMTESRLGLGGVLTSLPVLWVNHPGRNADASYKPVQLVTAVRCGLVVPETLVTNDAAAVVGFARRGETVAKAFGAPSVRERGRRQVALTHLLDEADLADLRGVEFAAHQFQRWVLKSYEARVIVVGQRLFAAGIYARSAQTRLDWRNDYSALRYEPVEPPARVVAGVRAYCAEFGLVYGAFDFVVRPDDEWVFLECNAGGQYGWIEKAIGAPITEALADLLERGDAT